MNYKIKTVMASDVPEALKLIMSDRRDELLELIVQRCSVDESGNPVDTSKLTLCEKLALVTLAGAEFSGVGEGND
jgi:hypothetical protein